MHAWVSEGTDEWLDVDGLIDESDLYAKVPIEEPLKRCMAGQIVDD